MILDGYVSLQTLFSRLAKYEAKAGDKIGASDIAAAQLQQRLVSGDLASFQCDIAGQLVPIPASDWQIDFADFRRELLRRRYVSAIVSEGMANSLVFPSPTSVTAENRGERRGRKAIDPAKLCAAVALANHEWGRQSSQADTIDKIQQAFERLYSRDKTPGDTTLQEIANAVMAALREAAKPTEK